MAGYAFGKLLLKNAGIMVKNLEENKINAEVLNNSQYKWDKDKYRWKVRSNLP